MWTYVQSTGQLLDPAGKLLAIGYSGLGLGKNDPAAQMIPNVGPLPCGIYTMELIADAQGNACDYGDKKAPVLRLIPDSQNVMFDRKGFLMHGDNATHTASDGCIIQDHTTRVTVSMSTDKKLWVVARLSDNHEEVQEAVNEEN